MYNFDLLEFRLSTLFSYRVAAVRHVHRPLDANGKNRPKADRGDYGPSGSARSAQDGVARVLYSSISARSPLFNESGLDCSLNAITQVRLSPRIRIRLERLRFLHGQIKGKNYDYELWIIEMNSTELGAALKSHGSKFVFNRFLMNEDVYVLRERYKENAIETYHAIKAATSDALDIPVKNVAIVGSAKTGYSLTPGRNFAPFNENSDLDLVIVSDFHFRELWGNYLDFMNSSTGYSYAPVAKNIFRHFISVKSENIQGDQLEYFSDWINRVDKLRKTFQLEFKLPADINYRIYDAWKYVEQYHVAGLNALIG